MIILECDKGYFVDKKIFCSVTEGLCGHVKMCQLNMRWHQTEQAKDCPLRGRDNVKASQKQSNGI